MKTIIKTTTAICALAILFTSCKDDRAIAAKKNVETYSTYVDSITNLDYAQAHSNWENIENGYENQKSMATQNLNEVQENGALKSNIDKSTLEFEEYKLKLKAEKERQEIITLNNNLRTSLLGEKYSNDDMTFEWINKDNILSVYQNFVDTVQANKDNYSREDWDEIKLMYEAIDTRKNTVEKEGLTSADNIKISELKLKFSPMYTLNRMGAKSDENANAKK